MAFELVLQWPKRALLNHRLYELKRLLFRCLVSYISLQKIQICNNIFSDVMDKYVTILKRLLNKVIWMVKGFSHYWTKKELRSQMAVIRGTLAPTKLIKNVR